MSETLWSLRARSLAKARKAFLRGDPEGLHDLRVALRRAEATAAALGRRKVERASGSLVRSLSPLRQLEVDRNLLARIRELGHVPENVSARLDTHWGAEYSEGIAAATTRIARSAKRRRLERKLRRLARRPADDIPFRLEIERRARRSRADQCGDRLGGIPATARKECAGQPFDAAPQRCSKTKETENGPENP